MELLLCLRFVVVDGALADPAALGQVGYRGFLEEIAGDDLTLPFWQSPNRGPASLSNGIVLEKVLDDIEDVSHVEPQAP